jgi:tetratricopeptide (TPR) repeat protein
MLLRIGLDDARKGEAASARALLDESLALCDSPFNEAQVTLQLGVIAFHEDRHEEALELVDRAAHLARGIHFVWWEANALNNGAEIALGLGDVPGGRERASTGLALAQSIGDRQGTVYGLALLAWAAADAGNPERAGRLWGAVEAEAARGPIGQWESESADYAGRVMRVAGPEFERAAEAGRRLALEDAVAYALGP